MTYTAARVIAAVLLALTGYVASQLIRDVMPEATAFGIFNYVNAVLGAIIGWIVIGSRTGRGYSNAISIGVTAGAVLIFWGLFLQASREMFALANKRRYDGPMEATVAVFQIGAEYFALMATPTILGAIAGGGIIAAICAEIAARKWR